MWRICHDTFYPGAHERQVSITLLSSAHQTAVRYRSDRHRLQENQLLLQAELRLLLSQPINYVLREGGLRMTLHTLLIRTW